MRALLDGIRLAMRAIVAQPDARVAHRARHPHRRRRGRHRDRARRSGAREHVSQQIQAIGSNFIIIFPQRVQASGARGAPGRAACASPRRTDAPSCASRRACVAIAPAAPLGGAGRLRGPELVDPGHRHDPAVLRRCETGRSSAAAAWDAHDEATKAKVVRPRRDRGRGTSSAPRTPSAARVRIGRYPYRVVGVLASKGEAPFGLDQDDIVLMPSASFRARVLHTPPGFAGVLMASADARPRRPTAPCARSTRSSGSGTTSRRARRRLRDPHAEGVRRAAGDKIYGILTDLLVFVAAISLDRRRHRRHEHHARERHRADARDRDPHGHRRARERHPHAVPRRGGGAVGPRRPRRRGPGEPGDRRARGACSSGTWRSAHSRSASASR